MSTLSLQVEHVNMWERSTVGERDKPRDGVGGPNGIANTHFGLQRVAARGDREHKTHRKRCDRRRQLVGCRDLKEGCSGELRG